MTKPVLGGVTVAGLGTDAATKETVLGGTGGPLHRDSDRWESEIVLTGSRREGGQAVQRFIEPASVSMDPS
ncbi:MAG TPA: hypothetical protein VFF40_10575 [Acidimicrobiia bacterium]|nr:hypothetical protein [Acidimicrobiia bacterium]